MQCLFITINAATLRDLLSRTKYADLYGRIDDYRLPWSIHDDRSFLEVGTIDLILYKVIKFSIAVSNVRYLYYGK